MTVDVVDDFEPPVQDRLLLLQVELRLEVEELPVELRLQLLGLELRPLQRADPATNRFRKNRFFRFKELAFFLFLIILIKIRFEIKNFKILTYVFLSHFY